MAKTLFSKSLDAFNAFAVAEGIPQAKFLEEVSDEVFDRFLFTQITQGLDEETIARIVFRPTDEQIMQLGVGAVVGVYVDIHDSDPRVITVEKIHTSPYCYHTESGCGDENSPLSPDMPMLYYKDPNGESLIVDEATGCQTINGGWVFAILDFGKRQAPHRNYMFKVADNQFAREGFYYRRDRPKNRRERILARTLDNRRRRPPRWGRQLWNENNKSFSLSSGTFSGNLFDLAFSIIERSPTLDIHYYIDSVKFVAEYNKAGKPGWTGPFVRSYWPDEPGSKRALPHGKVNVKAFRNWVLRNYKRFVPGEKQCRREGISRSLRAERIDYEAGLRDLDHDFGVFSRSDFDDDTPDFTIELGETYKTTTGEEVVISEIIDDDDVWKFKDSEGNLYTQNGNRQRFHGHEGDLVSKVEPHDADPSQFEGRMIHIQGTTPLDPDNVFLPPAPLTDEDLERVPTLVIEGRRTDHHYSSEEMANTSYGNRKISIIPKKDDAD